MSEGTALINIEEQMARDVALLKGRIQTPSGQKIRLLRTKKFRLPDGTEHPGPMNVVVVDFVSVNKFFDRPYKDGEIVPPACFSINLAPTGMVPSANSPDKQSEACDGCPNNEFGSKGDGKACGNHRLLAIVAGLGDLASDPKAPMWLLEVSPTGLKHFDAYAERVRTQNGRPLYGVVTEIFFDPSSEYPSLRFAKPEDNPNAALHYSRVKEAREILTREPDVSGYKPLAKKPGKK